MHPGSIAIPPLAAASGSSRERPRAIGWVRTGLGAAAAIVALVLLAREGMRRDADPAPIRAVRPAVLVAPAPVWQTIPQSKPHYAIDLPELRALPHTSGARRQANGGREDKLVYGLFESDGPYLRLALFRGPKEESRSASFFLDLARRAGEAGLAVVRNGRPFTVQTKLGALEAAEVVFSDSLERPCLAFRLHHAATGFSAHGWHCDASGTQQRLEPVCLIDRLAVLPAAEDPLLKVLFAEAERRRNPICGPVPEAKRKTA